MLPIIIILSGWSDAKPSESGEGDIAGVDWFIIISGSTVVKHVYGIAYIKEKKYLLKTQN